MIVPDIRPEWRTDTVIALCASMREAQDFNAMPILADALQDVGCDEEKYLAELRKPGHGWATASALVAMALLDSALVGEAVRWIEGMAERLGGPEFYGDGDDIVQKDPLTYETLLDFAREYNADPSEWPENFYMGTNEAYKEHFYDHEKEFWTRFSILTGLPVKDDEASFFSCGC